MVYLDKPMFGYAKNSFGAEYYSAGIGAHNPATLTSSRAVFAEVFKILKLNHFYGKSSVDVATGIASDTIGKEQLIFCIEVFLELGIFSFVSGSLQLNKDVRNELTNSVLYRKIAETAGAVG